MGLDSAATHDLGTQGEGSREGSGQQGVKDNGGEGRMSDYVSRFDDER